VSYLARLGLGTAQWGLEYGVANATGRPSAAAVAEMLDLGWSAGIGLLDTASVYGDAETILGHAHAHQRFRIVTKLAVGGTQPLSDSVLDGFGESLRRLGSSRVFGLLLHDANQLLGPAGDELWTCMASRKAAGAVEKLGVSVYTPQQLESVVSRFPIDIVQLPFNIYDQRFAAGGLLQRVRAAGIEIHVRSAFLQGLLLLPAERLPAYFDGMRSRHRDMHAAMGRAGWSPLEAALGFCLAQEFAGQVIVGCETPGQLQEILAAAARTSAAMPDFFSKYAVNDEAIILPTNWPKS
jgi:aryl-alcohol dehydrogenase-like predicted oxidoreductase